MEKSTKAVKGGILHKKTNDHEKEFTASVIPLTLQKYVLHESHTSLGHYSTSWLNTFFKKETVLLERFEKVCVTIFETLPVISNNKFTGTKLCPIPSRSPSDANEFYFKGSDRCFWNYVKRKPWCTYCNLHLYKSCNMCTPTDKYADAVLKWFFERNILDILRKWKNFIT